MVPGDRLFSRYYGDIWGEITDVTRTTVYMKWEAQPMRAGILLRTPAPAVLEKREFLIRLSAGHFHYAEPVGGVL